MKDILTKLIKEHGLGNVAVALGEAAFDIAETEVLPKNSGVRNSINYRLWQRAAVVVMEAGETVKRMHLPYE